MGMITACTTVLGTLADLGRALITADALHCRRDQVQFLAKWRHCRFTEHRPLGTSATGGTWRLAGQRD